MRLFEVSPPVLYLGSKVQLETGSSATPQGDTDRLAPGLESRLEAARPTERIPRAASLYLYETPPKMPFVYKVEANRLDRHHTSWLSLLKNADPKMEATMDEYVRGYWLGEPSDHAEGVWEFRTDEAEILNAVKSAKVGEVNPTAILSSNRTAPDLA